MQNRDDDSEPTAADRDESQEIDAAQAFDHLTQEVSTLQHTVEELVDALHLKGSPDYAPTLGEIAKELKHIAGRLGEIEGHPALRLAPADYPAALTHVGGDFLRTVADKFDDAARTAGRHTHELAALIGSVRAQDRQFKSLLMTGVVALTLGLVISPILARLVPFGGDGYVAAFIMNADRWNAGGALMAAHSPKAWAELGAAAGMLKSNKAAIEACREAAVKTKKEQHCGIVVPAP
jgi:hypothetical protein